MINITDKEFKELVDFMKNNYGINLINKRQLIEGRMSNLIAKKGMKTFTEYIELIKKQNSEEITTLINKLTTNHTFFYREDEHYKFLKEVILSAQVQNNKMKTINIWSSASSSGEEPYTIAMALDDFFGINRASWKINILATDISQNVLAKAKEGIYGEESIKNLPSNWKAKYLKKLGDGNYEIAPQIKKMVEYRTFNLMHPIPPLQKNKYQIVFCRNVMIYFDQKTKMDLVNRLYDAVVAGGYLFIGHSETIQRNETKFQYVKPAIYQK